MDSLFEACKNGSVNIANKLLENPGEFNLGYIDEDGNTALILACMNKLENIANKLLEKPDKCNIGQVNKNGKSISYY